MYLGISVMSTSSTQPKTCCLTSPGLYHGVGVFDLRRRFFPVLRPILVYIDFQAVLFKLPNLSLGIGIASQKKTC